MRTMDNKMLKKKLDIFIGKAKKLNGDPHYVALGMSIGVFVAITPTIPLHTIIAIMMAYAFKASKPAAILGVWFSNPFTVIFLYLACYKTGLFLFGETNNGFESIMVLIHQLESNAGLWEKILFLKEFIKTQLRVFMIMNIGGIVLGIPCGILTYFMTKPFISKIRKKSEAV